MTDPHEKEWIERAKAGDSDAISQLYQTHKEKVYKFLFFRVGSEADAEDLFQEVMMAAFESLPRFRGEVPFLHWCYQIARNKVAYFWRQKGQHLCVELHEEKVSFEEEWGEDPDLEENKQAEALINKEIDKIRDQVALVMEQLPENYRTVLHLRFFEGLTLSKIAEEMKISLGNAKVLQHRALKKAADLYAKLAPQP